MGTLLDQLAAKRQRDAGGHTAVIRIPRVEHPGVAFRVKAFDRTAIDKATRKMGKAKNAARRFDVEAAFLADAIVAVYLIDDSGGGNDEEVTFDELAAALDIPASPVHAIRALFATDGPYATDGDLIATVGEYVEWAQQKSEQLDSSMFDEDDDEDGDEGN